MELSEYIRSHEGYFWQWEDNGAVAAIPAGNTIAYRDLITDILEYLAPQGFPPFGALLLVLIATNTGGQSSINDIYNILHKRLGTNEQQLLIKATEFLNVLSHIHEDYKKGPKRVLLFRTLFENCHNKVASRKAGNIVHVYKNFRLQGETDFIAQPFSHGCFNRDFRTIALLYNRFSTTEDIINRIAALPDLPEELRPDASEQVTEPEDKDFIDQLIDNSKTFNTGALVRHIWSGLNIPVHNRLPSKQPLGGISDLTNKGDFDKLLVSEFANEDLVFLSRLANNEALFLHREVPPTNNDLERIILIDTSLRNWGTPKTVAFAVAIAIAHHPKTNIRCRAYIVGNTCSPVSIDNIHGVIEGLQMLETGLHAASGLDSFFREQQSGHDQEIFFISSPEAMRQAAMIKVMEEHRTMIHYHILADAAGNIDVYKKQQNSSRHVQSIQLPLKELWTQQKPKLQPGTQVRDVPGLCHYPILFRNAYDPKATLPAADGEIFQVTREKTLLRLFDKKATKYQRGWDVVFEKLPYISGPLEIGVAENGDYVLLMFNSQNRELILLNVSTGERRNVVFSEWTPSAFKTFMYYRDSFYYLASDIQWQIGFDGSIQKTAGRERELHTAYKERESAIANVSGIYAHAMLKNVRDIFINANGHLVLNTRELVINIGGHIKLEQTSEATKVAHAVKTGDSEFTFANGSMIAINRAGMAILHHTQSDREPIYIPLLLDMSLGVATNSAFAGNDYYQKEPMFEMILEDAGPQKLEVVRQVKEITGLGLGEIKEMLGRMPRKLMAFTPRETAEQFRGPLEKSGARVSINPATGRYPVQEKISVQEFFKRYINPFIQQILNYATGH